MASAAVFAEISGLTADLLLLKPATSTLVFAN